MKKTTFTISAFLFLSIFISFPADGQPTDCVPSSGENATISFGIGIVPTLNGSPLPNGSYISAMFNSSNGLKCAGFIKWEGNPTGIAVQGANGAFEGYAGGEPYKYRIQLPNGVVIQNSNINVTYKPIDPICDNGPNYKKDGLSCIQSFAAMQSTSSNDIRNEVNSSIFPNPSSGIINFKTTNNLSNRIIVSDINGRGFTFDVNNGSVDLSILSSGIYFITGYSGNKAFREKLILVD